MKILHIVRQYAPSKGGLETYVHNLAKTQIHQGNEIQILTLDRVFGTGKALREIQTLEGISIKRISFLGTRQCFLPFLNPFFLKEYDVIHLHGLDQIADSIAFYSIFCKKLRKKIFLTTHGLFFHTTSLQTLKKFYFQSISRFTLGRFQKIFSVSYNDKNHLEKIGQSSEVLYNPILPYEGIKASGKDFIYIGRLSENKRLKLLLDVYKAIKERDIEIGQLHIVGSDAEGLKASLQAYTEKLDLKDHVIFHGFLEADPLKEIINRSKYNISASRYEGFGLAMLEGMSAGLLPVMHNNEAFQEIEKRSGVGFISNFNKVTETAEAFIQWQESVTDTMQETAIHFALSQTYEKLCADLEVFYQNPPKEEALNTVRPLCGVPVHVHTQHSAIKHIRQAYDQKTIENICFFNSNLAIHLEDNPKRDDILKTFTLILNDGIGTDLGSLALYRKKFPDNLNGTDFVPILLRNIPVKSKIALYGAKDHVIHKAADILRNDYDMNVVFVSNGYGDLSKTTEELSSIEANILFVAQGNPLQEETICKLRKAGITIPIMIGVGACFDFMTKTVKRAPHWVQSLRMEWVYRFCQEPKRLFKRYTVDIVKYFQLLWKYRSA